ncbi:helix-turn-helix domain-containing protein [Lichenicola sp.]|uniref:helix-turn-helix domain-containing protein n=1 Tax=Lichenicola sp. TaxID=2804529 RepID=UPI003B00600A
MTTLGSFDRRILLPLFQQRLRLVLARSELSQTDFARAAGIDRSTLSQLLTDGADRLPRVESLAAIAQVGSTSLDWLLGLSQDDQMTAGVVTESLQIERDAPSPLDERLLQWHREAAGYRIRHIPTTFPDVLKTEAIIEAEYGHFVPLGPRRRIEITQSRLEYLRQPETEIECCTALQTLEALARGEDIWRLVPPSVRRAQIEQVIALCDELYPRFRLFLYDRRLLFSVPLTVFGPLRAAIYLGQTYFVFHSTEHIRALTRHFDQIVRGASIQPTEIIRHLQTLLSRSG